MHNTTEPAPAAPDTIPRTELFDMLEAVDDEQGATTDPGPDSHYAAGWHDAVAALRDLIDRHPDGKRTPHPDAVCKLVKATAGAAAAPTVQLVDVAAVARENYGPEVYALLSPAGTQAPAHDWRLELTLPHGAQACLHRGATAEDAAAYIERDRRERVERE